MAFRKNFIFFVMIITLIIFAININFLISQKTKPPVSTYKNDPFALFKSPATWKWILLIGLVLLVTGLILLYLRVSSG